MTQHFCNDGGPPWRDREMTGRLGRLPETRETAHASGEQRFGETIREMSDLTPRRLVRPRGGMQRRAPARKIKMRNMSFSMTTQQLLDGIKDVTRRRGWWFLKPGDKVRAVKKAMGLKKGEKIEPLGVIEIVSTRREPLRRMTDDHGYGFDEVRREGFENHPTKGWPVNFVEFFCEGHNCQPTDDVNRIEFKFTPNK